MEVLVDDHVLVFDIPVRDTHAMKVMYGFDDLREDIPGLMFWNTFMWGLFYAFEEIVRSTSIHSGAWRCRSRRKALRLFLGRRRREGAQIQMGAVDFFWDSE